MSRFSLALTGIIVLQSFSMGVAQRAEAAATYYIANQCYLPGPGDNASACTVNWGWSGNPPNNVLCLWTTTNDLYACEGTTVWSQRYEFVSAPNVTLELRHHTTFPGKDPSWPNYAVVRSHGTLVYSRTVSALTSTIPNGLCNSTIGPGTDINAAVSSASVNATICLNSGTYNQAGTISMKSGQTLKSVSAASPATINNVSGISTEDIVEVNVPSVTIRDLNITSPAVNRAGDAISIYGTNGTRIYNVAISYTMGGVAINDSTDVEINKVSVSYAGDGKACSSGCASPSLWTNDSSNVRIIAANILNNGVGPGGDGEVSCYNSTNWLVQDSKISHVGAGGLYIVSCDYALILHNTITYSSEWGLDIVNTGYSSGTDWSLFDGNTINHSGNGGGVIVNSAYDTFSSNTFSSNRQRSGASGSCDALNVRTDYSKLQYFPNIITNDASVNNNELACSDD
ncbi:MAG TPA: right-handed parallel beta-helix repeat-containing protein [Rudaea sp.]|jgi:nitrous oxidase accessory protein NosD|nr:right-handed parallel beta-helix repeat-containing protein [Rudaea sp.]